ncbi:hypothetical protein Tco_0456168 [Tanacetum coccineum]
MSLLTPSDIQYSAATQIWGCYRFVSRAKVIENQGADEELSDGGSPWVIVYGYDGLPMQLVAPPSPDYIPGPKEPQTPPVPQDKDEPVDPKFIQPHDTILCAGAMYPRISHWRMRKNRSKEVSREYEDDETEDGPVDYPMDGGEDRDDDDGDSHGDDADDEDEEDEDEEDKEEYLPLADSAVVVPTVELVSPPEGIEPVKLPPSTDNSTTGARITVQLQASISLPPEAEVERLLAMPTPPPSPLISLSPPRKGVNMLRIASSQGALVDRLLPQLPSPPLSPLPPSLYIPPPVFTIGDDISESELTPLKCWVHSLSPKYKDGEIFYC